MPLRILMATDFSVRSQRALRRAGLLAQGLDAVMTLVHVVEEDRPPPMVERDRREAERFLREQRDAMSELRGLQLRVMIVAGDAFAGILRASRQCSADLIVMGAHRKKLLRDVFTGTTLERVIRTGPYPVLMVNAEPLRPYAKVMIAVDLSEHSAHAIQRARELGLTEVGSVTLVHGFAPMVWGHGLTGAGRGRSDAYLIGERARAERELTAFLEARGLVHEGWTHRVSEGSAMAAITEAVQALSPDLVVIGTRGRSALTAALLGSVAEHVLRSLDVDVLTVPLPSL